MQIETIITTIIMVLSTITTCGIMAIKFFKKIKMLKDELKKDVDNIKDNVDRMTEAQKLEMALAEAHQENAALKRQLNVTLAKLNHMHIDSEV